MSENDTFAETGQRVPFDRTLRAMKSAFEGAGVIFVLEGKGEGVILYRDDSEDG